MKKHQFLFTILMAVVMMAISPQKVWALGGSGTSSSPYTIASAADLVAFANKVNGGETGAYAKLTADITLTSAWTSIGNSSKIYTGTFDGQGHKISGLSLTATAANAGLFGYVNGATIKNFSLAGSVSSNSDNVGSVVGHSKGNTQILDVVSSVNITMSANKSHLGGIVGYLCDATGDTPVIKGCTYSGTMDVAGSTDSNGGIVGYGLKNANISITNCFFSGTIKTTGSNARVGGILGYADDDGSNFVALSGCFVNGSFSTGSGTDDVGAIAGMPRGNTYNVIKNNNCLSGIATHILGNNFERDGKCDASNKAITISVTAGSNGTVSQSYVNPTSTAATQLQVVATPDAHYHLNKWSDNGAQTHNVGLTDNVILSASFAIDQHTISVATNNANYGTVSGGGTFDYGTTNVSITATPKEHYHFVQWNDGVKTASRQITVTEDKTYTATFAIDQHTITVQVASGQGSMGTVSGGGTFDYNSSKTITATPKEHYHFVKWNDGDTNASRTITVTENKTYTATFAPNPYTITVNVANGQTDMGTVSGGGTFDYGSTKTITATPKEHYHFVKWSDGNTNASRQIMVNGNATYTATFAIDQHTITVQANNDDYGTVSGSGTYNYGTQQTITATPEEHYHFVQWNDGNTDASHTITVTDDAQQNTYTATFAIDQHTIALNVNNSNMGTVTGSGTFDYNSQQVITAMPNTGCDFIGWSDGVKDATRQITVTDDAQQNTYTANFIQARAILTDGTLTFYYDGIDHDGTAYPLNTGADLPGWHEKNSDITTVVFDASFASMRPTSCAFWFDDCKNLSSITGIEYLNTERVTTMEYMFNECRVLSSLDVTRFNTEQVTTMESMFYRCENLTSLDVSGFNTARVTGMESMFYSCKKLTSLNLSSFNTANVGNMSYMFSNCRELSELTIGNFDMQRVFDAYRMFYDPETYLSLSALNTLTLKSLPFLADGTFNTQFTGLGKTVNVILDDNSVIYEGTNYLPTITNCNHYKHWGDDLVCTLCHQPAAITHTGTCGTCTWTIYENGHMIIEPTEGESGTLAYWGEESFAPWLAHYSEIKSVEFRGEVRASTCYRLFMWCNYLRNIDFKGFNTANVTNMKQMFAACKSLQTLDLSSFNTANVGDMSDMFMGCFALESLDLSSFNTANVQDMSYMFSYCQSLATLKLSNDFVLKEGVNKEQLFQGCGRYSDRLSIFYVIDQSIIKALESDTQLGTHEFVRSAIVKDGVPFMTAIWAWDIPAGNIVFTRTFTPNKPATITLPFEVHVDVVTNAKFYGFTSLDYNNATGKWEANMDRVKDDFIHAYTPYMVLPEAESIDFDYVNASFMPTPSELYNTTQGDWTFVATNEAKVWTDDDFANGEVYYGFAAGNETTPEGKFVKVGAGASIDPLRAYIMKTPAAGPANAPARAMAADQVPSTITVRLNEESSTGIGTLNTETGQFTFDGWYDLQGRRISEPVKDGISINNGKKIMVK